MATQLPYFVNGSLGGAGLVGADIVFADSPYTVPAGTQIVRVDTAGGAVTVTLPDAAAKSPAGTVSGFVWVVDAGANAGTNAITVAAPAGDTLAGEIAAPGTIDVDSAGAMYISNGASGWILAASSGLGATADAAAALAAAQAAQATADAAQRLSEMTRLSAAGAVVNAIPVAFTGTITQFTATNNSGADANISLEINGGGAIAAMTINIANGTTATSDAFDPVAVNQNDVVNLVNNNGAPAGITTASVIFTY